QNGEDYREIELTSDAEGSRTFYRTSPNNGHLFPEPGETYSGRVGVGNPNSYPITLRAGFIRTETANITLSSTRTDDVTVPAGGYEEIEIPAYTIDDSWTVVRVGFTAPSTGNIPEGSKIHIHDGITVARDTSCPYLIHGDLDLNMPVDGLVGDWYSLSDRSASRLAAPGVPQATPSGRLRTISSPTWGTHGTSLKVMEGGLY